MINNKKIIDMKRKISDQHVAIIKIMLSQGYSSRAITDELFIKHGHKIHPMFVQYIKKGEAYKDVREDLNDIIFSIVSDNIITDKDKIPDIKWSLANGYSEEDIQRVFGISKSKLYKIKMLHAPFRNISPEYNDVILSLHRRKKCANIDKNMVIEIKRRYIASDGKASFSEIGDAFKISAGTVSTILRLKKYSDYGISYNPKIISIKSKMAKEKKKTEEHKRRLNKGRAKINELYLQKKQLSDIIRMKRSQLKEMSV